MPIPLPPSPSLSVLLNQQQAPQILQSLISYLQNPGTGLNGQQLQPVPVTAWGDTSFGPYILNMEANSLATLNANIVTTVNGGYLSLALNPALQWTAATIAAYNAQAAAQVPPGQQVPTYLAGTSPWVDIGAAQVYNLLRQPPNTAIITVNLTAASGVGPTAITTGSLTLSDGQGNFFQNIALPASLSGSNVTSGTVPKGGTLAVAFTALSPGAAGNLSNTQPVTLTTQLPGITPAVATNPILQAGANVESDTSLISRCYNQWSAMGTGSPSGVWQNWCFAASNEVRFATVQPTGYGTMSVFVYGQGAAVSSVGLSTIAAFLNARVPNCITLAPAGVLNAVPLPINPTGTPPAAYATLSVQLWGPQSASSSGTTAAQAAITQLIKSAPVGGWPLGSGASGISNAQFVDAIMNSSSAITKCVVSVSNYQSSTLLSPSGANVDLLLPPAATTPVVATLSNAPTIQWNAV